MKKGQVTVISITLILVVLVISLIAIWMVMNPKSQSSTATGQVIEKEASSTTPQEIQKQDKNMETKNTRVLLETNYGNITVEMYSDMPITTGNFLSLVNKGFYNGVIFHRVIDGFMIQGGDPQGTGMGGPGYTIKDEFTHAGGNKDNRGTIAMANAGPNTGGSQFFINLVNNNFLDTKHPAFGQVISGMDVVDKIAKVSTDSTDRPVQEVKIIEARVLS